MEARTKTIEEWFSMITQGQLALPRFQRYEAWRPNQVEGILENILRNPSLPIGALLTLDVGDSELFHSREVNSAPNINETPQMHLLDGQQRLTALWRSLHNNYDEMTVFIKLHNSNDAGIEPTEGDTEEEQVVGNEDFTDVEIVKRWDRDGMRYPVWADNPQQILSKNLAPIDVLLPGSKGEDVFDRWCDESGLDRRTERYLTKLRSRLANYPIPFLSLPVKTSQETALNVFINMNTSATPLKDFDIVTAQLEGAVGESFHQMIDDLKEETEGVSEFGKIEDLALSTAALLLGRPPLKKTYLSTDFGEGLAKVWAEVKIGIGRGLDFLRDEAIFADFLLPTEVALYLTSALWARVPEHGHDIEGRARTIIRKALWRASYTDRYLKTASTRGFSDYIRLSNFIEDNEDRQEPELFNEEVNPLPSPEELMKAGWPSRKDRMARAIIATSLKKGGNDFADGAPAGPHNVGKREWHHIVPVGVLGVERDDPYVSRALNCALITWRTNRKISAQTPREYLDARASDALLGEAEVRARLESHMIPYDALIDGDYEEFLRVRAVKIHEAMTKLCNGEAVN